MKITASVLKDVRYGYLYATGDLVLIHEIDVPKVGRQEYVTLHTYAGKCRFSGRVILGNRGTVKLALSAVEVAAEAPSISRGSNNSKAKGQPVGFASFRLAQSYYSDTVTIYELPGLIGTDITVQESIEWTPVEPDASRWASMPLHVGA